MDQTEKNVLDVLGRDSARIRALPTPDMRVGLPPPQTQPVEQQTAPFDFESQIADATIMFVEELTTGKFCPFIFIKILTETL